MAEKQEPSSSDESMLFSFLHENRFLGCHSLSAKSGLIVGTQAQMMMIQFSARNQ